MTGPAATPSRIGLLHGEITEAIIGAFHQVHYELGFGYLEHVYANAMTLLLTDDGLRVQRELPVEVLFRGRRAGFFRADLVVSSKVLIEIKAAERLDLAWEPQLINYLRATELEVGLLLFFGPKAIFRRRILTNDRKVRRPQV